MALQEKVGSGNGRGRDGWEGGNQEDKWEEGELVQAGSWKTGGGGLLRRVSLVCPRSHLSNCSFALARESFREEILDSEFFFFFGGLCTPIKQHCPLGPENFSLFFSKAPLK